MGPSMSVAKKMSRFAAFSARRRERFARSVHVFLVGVIIACGIEVAVDWHATLGEVRALRMRVKERGQNYAAVLVRPLAPAVARRDVPEIARLTSGVFEDQEVVFVRVVGPDQKTIYESLDPDFGSWFQSARKQTFDDYYAHQLGRDAKGIIGDPDGLRSRMEGSRHHDFAQGYQDFLISLGLAKPERVRLRSGEAILFQDRLYTTNKKEHDDLVTYAIGRIDGGDPKATDASAFIVAFDMRPTNAAIRGKYLKGFGLVAFFVLLILVQNVSSRREKLRLLDLESKYASAKKSIREALPAPIDRGGLRVSGAITQSVGSVDGMIFDAWPTDDGVEIVLLDPEGDGVEAAATALHVRATYRHRREDGVAATIREELAALGSASMRIPGKRPLGAVVLRLRSDGTLEGTRCGMSGPRVVAGDATRAIDERPEADVPAGLTEPMATFSGKLDPGALLVLATDGLGGATRRIDPDAVAAFAARARKNATDLASVASDAATWARGTSAEIAQDDILVVLAERPI